MRSQRRKSSHRAFVSHREATGRVCTWKQLDLIRLWGEITHKEAREKQGEHSEAIAGVEGEVISGSPRACWRGSWGCLQEELQALPENCMRGVRDRGQGCPYVSAILSFSEWCCHRFGEWSGLSGEIKSLMDSRGYLLDFHLEMPAGCCLVFSGGI